jgi:hypothetical protein
MTTLKEFFKKNYTKLLTDAQINFIENEDPTMSAPLKSYYKKEIKERILKEYETVKNTNIIDEYLSIIDSFDYWDQSIEFTHKFIDKYKDDTNMLDILYVHMISLETTKRLINGTGNLQDVIDFKDTIIRSRLMNRR